MKRKVNIFLQLILKLLVNIFGKMISKDKNLWLFGSWFGTRYADILVMGDDWKGKFDWVKESSACDVLYLPRTPSTSTTEITEIIEIVKSID